MSCLVYFVLEFFSPFSVAITLLGEDRVNQSDFRTFGQFALVGFRLFSLPLGGWEVVWLVIVILLALFSQIFVYCSWC